MNRLPTRMARSTIALLGITALAFSVTACSLSVNDAADATTKPEVQNSSDTNSSNGSKSSDQTNGTDDTEDSDSGTGTDTSQTTACSGKQPVAINTASSNVTLTGECGIVTVNATDATLTAESIDELIVNGASVTVTVDSVSSITLIGADNTITWSKGNPAVTDLGADNVISQR